MNDLALVGGLLTSVVGLLVWLNKDSQKKLDVLSARSDKRLAELTTHYEVRIKEITDAAEARVQKVTDAFVAELRSNRDAAILRQEEDRKLHESYQAAIRALTDEVKRITRTPARKAA